MQTPPADPTLRRGRVLIVDDDPIVAASLRRLLANEHDVLTACDGRDALRVLATDSDFDVILCDVSMDGMSGLELYRHLAAERPGIVERITFLTGGAFTAEAQEFLDRLPNERLEKPIALATLRQFVRSRVASTGR